MTVKEEEMYIWEEIIGNEILISYESVQRSDL